MGALTLNRKRAEDYSIVNSKSPGLLSLSNFEHISKKQKLSHSFKQMLDQPTPSKSIISRFFMYPETKLPFGREVHAPCRQNRFGFSIHSQKNSSKDRFKGNSVGEMGNTIMKGTFENLKAALDSAKERAFGTFRSHFKVEEDVEVTGDKGRREVDALRKQRKNKEVVDVDNEVSRVDVSEDSSIEDVEIVEVRKEGCSVVPGKKCSANDGLVLNLVKQNHGKGVEGSFQPSSSSMVVDTSDGDLKVDSTGKMLDTLSLSREPDNLGMPLYNMLLDSAQKRDVKLQDLSFKIKLKEKLLETQQLLRPQKQTETPKKDVVAEAFTPLTEEEENEVSRAFSNLNRRKVLVTHKNSNIDITGELLRCLKPGAWLNDEIINVYLELLKERENREPQRFLKCHFFNTFFYKKLISGRGSYNFQSVRRWTSQRKLGYSLLDCDKIFVPIHKEIHWCLAVINKKDEKFQYLDSLGGFDMQVIKVLARYYVDEVKDKTGKDIDVSSWRQEFVEDLPEQENGYDCGVFMVKYADFYSRGVGLCFGQEHMPYFRLRTAKEILRLRAE